MISARRRVHGGLLLASGLLGVSLSVLILGASRGQATDAGLPGSAAPDFSLRDGRGTGFRLGQWRDRAVVLVVTQHASTAFAKPAVEINQICDTFANDDAVKVVGVQVTADDGLLASTARTAGVLESKCPALTTLQDVDGSVARAYRVMESPTAFVIDDKGVVRARVALDHDGAAVAVAGTVSSIRRSEPGLAGVKLPN